MINILEQPTKILKFHVVSENTVFYVFYDNGKITIFSDESYRYQAALWHWQEKEIQQAIKEYVENNNEII